MSPGSPARTEKRTTFRGVSSEDAESASEMLDTEFFRVGRSSFIPSCRRDASDDCVTDGAMDELRCERGVDGAVDVVSVDSDAFESDGVRMAEREDVGVDGVGGFLSDDRAGGGGRDMGGAEPLLRCVGRLGLGGPHELDGERGASVSRPREPGAREAVLRCGVREMCRPIAICSTVGLVVLELKALGNDDGGGSVSSGVESIPASCIPRHKASVAALA